MMKHRSGMRQYVRLILVYALCLMIIAALAGIVTYTKAVHSYNEEVVMLNRGSMSQYAEIFQSRIVSPVENQATTFLINADNNTLLSNLYYRGGMSLNIINKLMKKMNEVVSQNIGLYSDFRMYDADRRCILSTTIGYYNEADHESINHYENVWTEALEGGWHGPFVSDYPGITGYQVIYALPYPVNSRGNSAKAYAVFEIGEQQIRSILLSLCSEPNEELMILDGSGRIISSTMTEHIGLPTEKTGMPDISADEGFGLRHYKKDGSRVILCHSEPLTNGWRIVRQIPSNVFYASLRAMSAGMLLSLAGTLLIGALLALYFSRRLYKPVQTLTRWLVSDPSLSGSMDDVKNEYAFIDNAVRSMRTELDKMRGQLEDSGTIAKNYLIFSLVNGTIYSEEDFRKRLAQIGYSDTGCRYNVACVMLSAAMINAPDPQQVSLIKLDMLRRLESLSNESRLVLACELRNDQLAAIMLTDSTAVSDDFEQLGLEFMSQYERHVRVSVGEWQDSPLNLKEAYAAAMDAQRYHFFHPDWLYCAYDMICRPDAALDAQRLESYELAFIEAVENGQRDEAIDALHLFSYEEQDHVYDFETASKPLDVMAEAVRAAATSEEGKQVGIQFIEKNRGGRFKSIREYASEMCRVLYDVLELPAAAQEEDQRHSHAIEQLMAYINQNLCTELSLTSLADYVNLSSSYLSRLFKKETGETIVEYITTQRLELARQLLEQTDQSIEMITQQAGYPTHHYFSRKFKERFDMTPKDYRQSFRLKKQGLQP